jgi:hypothetical protein
MNNFPGQRYRCDTRFHPANLDADTKPVVIQTEPGPRTSAGGDFSSILADQFMRNKA